MDGSVFGASLLVVGAEPLLVERQVDEWVGKARHESADAELADLGAPELGEGRLLEAMGGSLFASRSIVVVRDLTAVPDEQSAALLEAVKAPGADLCLIVAHPGGVKGKSLLDRVAKAATQQVRVDPVKAYQLPGYVSNEARRLGMRMDAVAAQGLVEAVGTDLRALSAAVAQLGSDFEGEHVDVSMVARYFAGRAEVTGFAVTDDVMRGRPTQALSKLRWALSTGAAPAMITAAMAGALRSLGKYLELRSARLSPNDLAREVGVPAWKLKDLAVQARDWSPRSVAASIQAVAQADAQVKGAATDPNYALERLVLSIDRMRRAG
ncbi:MAG: DNA polymerase III subunit delta [Propionibacteriaceae bacterium]|nr:DNA polymerase III subunit delta [Propionibacteriaceae bacterium]